MKTTKKIILASAILGLALFQSAQAQNPVLVAGWDFNSLNPAGLQAVAANYSDGYAGPVFPTTADQGSAAPRGSFLANGSGGSELLPLSGSTGVSVVSGASSDTISRAIDTRPTGANKFFDNGNFGTTDNAMQVAASTSLSPQTFAFQVDTTGLTNLTSISLFLAKSSATPTLSIAWGYKVGAGAVQSLVTSNLNSLGTTYTNLAVDLSSILGNQGLVSIVGTATSTNAGVFSLRIDNTGVYGVTSAIPEPGTYAAILGALTMGVVALRRRRQVLA